MFFLFCATGGLVLVALLARHIEKSWTSPGAFFALLWCCYSFSVWLFDMPADVLVLGLLWVLISCLLVQAGCLFGRGQVESLPSRATDLDGFGAMSLPYLKTLTLGLSVVGLFYALVVLFREGTSIGEVLSFAYLNQLVMFNRATFVYGPEKLSVPELVAYAFFYTAPLFGGLLFRTESTFLARAISLLSVLAPSAVGLLYGSRMGALFGGSFWISAFIASHVFGTARPNSTRGMPVTKALLAASLFILGIPAVVIFMRYEEGQFVSLKDFLETAGDILSFLPSFAVSLNEEGLKVFDLTYGVMTFGRILEIATFRFAEHVAYDAIDVGYTSSNVFTIFRGLIDDFGHLGALVAIFLFGIVGGVSYKSVINGNPLFVPPLIAVYAGVFTSFSFSLFSYSTPTLALCFFSGYVVMVEKFSRRAKQSNHVGVLSRLL